jgi:putative ABC transport system substrate-binding protein
VVFGMGSDPVAAGIVRSLNRPGGNATGVNILTIDIEAKRLGLLSQLVPNGLIGALINPAYPPAAQQVREIREAAQKLGRALVILNASTDPEIDAAFATLSDKSASALLVGVDPFFDTRLDRIVALAAQRRLPAIYQFREYVLAGGLMSYGVKLAYAYRNFGIYAGKILKGAKPADLPVLQSIGFECLINQKAAKALGLTIPPLLLGQADEIIE